MLVICFIVSTGLNLTFFFALSQGITRMITDNIRITGKRIAVCPTGTLQEGSQGFRIQIGEKLGWHPQLVRELPGIYSEKEVANIIDQCLDYSQQNSFNGERVGKILEQKGFGSLFKN